MGACFCIGPQNGQPLCPCKMRGVTIKDGRYVREEDLGPVNDYPRDIIDEYSEKLTNRTVWETN